MKYSAKNKNKILDKILASHWDTSTYQVNNISNFIESCSFITFNELLFYLHILTFEHLIDADIENNQIKSIYIFPDAFSHHATAKSENVYKNITLFFAIISTVCTLIQVIDLFLQVSR